MDSILHFQVLVFVCRILTCQTIAWDQNSLPRPVITRNHRRLKGFTFNTFHSASLVTCSLRCQRNPRCVSTNFRKLSSLEESKGVCELNEKGALSPIEEKELEHDEESVYTQFNDMEQHDCRLTGCSNAGTCTYIEESKVFNCHCQAGWCGRYCEVDHVAAVGMQSGAILDSWITASSEYFGGFYAHQARLHFIKTGEAKGSCWLAGIQDLEQWLQVDLQKTRKIAAIATQGRGDYSSWVKQYKLQYGDDGHAFSFYRRIGDQTDTLFPGNTNMNTVVYHELNPMIKARYIRVRPTSWKLAIAMRMELYTC